MSGLPARIATWTHEGLSVAVHRLAEGHTTLVETVAGRPVWWPARAGRVDDEQPDTEDEQPDDEALSDDETPAPEKTNSKGKAKEKGRKKQAPPAPEKTNGKAKEKGKGKGKGKGKEEQAPPAHTMYRPGPRRAFLAAIRWTADADGFGDFLLRAGLVAAPIGALAYFTRPFLATLSPVVLCTIAAIIVTYEISPRLSIVLATGLTVALIDPVWLGIGAVVLLAVELAPALATIFILGLTAALVHPALMWPTTVAWAVAAWCAGAPEEEDEEPAEEAAEEAGPEDPRTYLVKWLDGLTRGTSGIHLKELHAALAAHPELAALTRKQMRAWLNRHEITVDRSLRVGEVSGRSGIARSTIETLLEAPFQPPSLTPLPLAASGVETTQLHASDLHKSPHSPGVEQGVESGVELPPGPSSRTAGTAPGSPETTPTAIDSLYV